MKRDYLGYTKLNAGPGGWTCPCCNPYGCKPAKMKSMAHRHVRRTFKHELSKLDPREVMLEEEGLELEIQMMQEV